MNTKYLTCACFAEALRVTIDEEDGELYLTVMEPRGVRSTWSWRLRVIWRILTKGVPFDDEIILQSDERHAFTAWLQEHDDV